jgi:putative ABC transport system permease protein
MEQHLALVLARERLVAWVSGLFSIVALALTSVGIYGLLAGLVASRTREIGIRTALGARSGDVLRLVLGRVAGLVGAGLGAGVLATFGATRLVRGLLFEVAPSDPPTILAVAATVIGAALLAAYVPARRAARVDPARALRVD